MKYQLSKNEDLQEKIKRLTNFALLQAEVHLSTMPWQYLTFVKGIHFNAGVLNSSISQPETKVRISEEEERTNN